MTFFQRDLPMVLVQKLPFSHFFFLGNIREENVFYDILEQKNGFLRYKNKTFKKSKNWSFSKRVKALVQKWPFLQLFFLGNIDKENVFYIILERKNAFLGYKNKKFKNRKIDVFSKGLTHGFGPKMAIFPSFCLANIAPKNVFYDILERKHVSLGYKNKKLKKTKNWHFSKGFNPLFWSKNGHFPHFNF